MADQCHPLMNFSCICFIVAGRPTRSAPTLVVSPTSLGGFTQQGRVLTMGLLRRSKHTLPFSVQSPKEGLVQPNHRRAVRSICAQGNLLLQSIGNPEPSIIN